MKTTVIWGGLIWVTIPDSDTFALEAAPRFGLRLARVDRGRQQWCGTSAEVKAFNAYVE